MKRMTRIRWNADERAAVVRRAQTLLAEDPDVRSNELFSRSQDGLPKERRRRGSAAAHAWLRAELKRAGPLPSPASVWRAPSVTAATPAAPESAATSSAVADTGDRAASDDAANAAAPPSPLTDAMIEAGVQVLTGILRDARVRAALEALVQGVFPAVAGQAVAASPDAAIPPLEQEASTAHGPVLVAGCSADEARELEKEIDGALPLQFWAADAPREQLMEMLPRASLVIGVSERLSQSVESSLTRLGTRYVRHSGGIPGLYRRLAELALQ